MKQKILKAIESKDLSLTEKINIVEKALMLESLERNNWIKLKAAQELRVTYRIFNYKYSKFGLDELNPRRKKLKSYQII